MKFTLKNVKDLQKSIDNDLVKEACNYIVDRWDDYDDKKSIVNEVLEYDCKSGIVSSTRKKKSTGAGMMSKKKFFDITYSKMTLEQKFDYIKNHLVYNVMNSWNNWESLANNVKIHNLGLTSEQENKFFEIYGDEHACNQLYCFLNDYIDNFDVEHNTRTYYNGRQDGYLVTRYKDTQTPIIDDAFYTCSNYLDLADNFQNWYNYTRREARRDAKYLVNTTFKFVQAFDRLCDDMRTKLIYILDNVELKTDDYTIKKEYKYLDFEAV